MKSAAGTTIDVTVLSCGIICRWEPNTYAYHGDDGKVGLSLDISATQAALSRCTLSAALQGQQLSGCACPVVVLLTVSCCLQLFHDSGSGVPYGPKWAAGDTVGAGWNLQWQEIFFT